MKDLEPMVQEFEQLRKAIDRLKHVEKVLNDMRQFEEAFGPDMAAIRRSLKSPDRVDQVEQDLVRLQAKIAAPRVTRPLQEQTIPEEGGPVFPQALAGLYSNASYIGGGGFAHVFKATRKQDSVEVAIKVPDKLDATTGRSFLNEMKSWERLNHENICKLMDLNILPVPYLEMELCQGSLDDWPKPLDADRAVTVICQVAAGVNHAHSQGVFHRDLKPRNILLRGEVPVVSDWGLSKLASEGTSSKVHALTPAYAAPEQIVPDKFGKTDHRTDMYQLGVIFYELVTGELPFNGRDLTELFAQIVMADPKKPSETKPEASGVEPIIMKCLCKDKEQRYQSVTELLDDLAPHRKTGD